MFIEGVVESGRISRSWPAGRYILGKGNGGAVRRFRLCIRTLVYMGQRMGDLRMKWVSLLTFSRLERCSDLTRGKVESRLKLGCTSQDDTNCRWPAG